MTTTKLYVLESLAGRGAGSGAVEEFTSPPGPLCKPACVRWFLFLGSCILDPGSCKSACARWFLDLISWVLDSLSCILGIVSWILDLVLWVLDLGSCSWLVSACALFAAILVRWRCHFVGMCILGLGSWVLDLGSCILHLGFCIIGLESRF